MLVFLKYYLVRIHSIDNIPGCTKDLEIVRLLVESGELKFLTALCVLQNSLLTYYVVCIQSY